MAHRPSNPSSRATSSLPCWATLQLAGVAVLSWSACAGMSDSSRDTAIGAAMAGVAGSQSSPAAPPAPSEVRWWAA